MSASALAFVSLIGGCQVVDENPVEENSAARIIWGASIDGVRLGDDSTMVRDKLGVPNEVGIGDFPGVIFVYNQGQYSGISATIWTETELGVQELEVTAPYSGKTSGGIGIGSRRSEVMEVFLEPEKSNENSQDGERTDIYSFGNNKVVIDYLKEVVISISMSPQK